MFAKAVVKHLEKYLHFNGFSLLHMDSLDNFDSDSSTNISLLVPIPVPVSADSSSSLSSVSYKTSNGSTISTSRARKDLASFHCTTQKLVAVVPVSPIPVS